MSQLAALQEAFRACLQEGAEEAIADRLAPAPRAPLETLLGVYRSAYVLRLLEALAAGYPVLKQIAGDEEFDRIGRAYVAAHPSTRFSIRWFGDRLAEFLASAEEWSDCPWLAEMAAFEWSLGLAFDGPDAIPIEVADLAGLPPEAWDGLRLTLLPGARRLALTWSIPQAWRAITDGADEVPPPEATDPPVTWLIWRPERLTLFRSLDAVEAASLDSVANGVRFGELCEQLSHRLGPDRASARAGSLLRRWVEEGLIASADPG